MTTPTEPTNPLEGRENCANCRHYEPKPTRRPPRLVDMIGRCNCNKIGPPEELAARPYSQYATNGSNCPCWRAIRPGCGLPDPVPQEPVPKEPVPQEPPASEAARAAALLEHLAVKAAGFAGVKSSGELVDRRDWPDATPVAANAFLDIPEPTRCYRIQCRSLRIAWLDKHTGETECLECGKLQLPPTHETTDPQSPHVDLPAAIRGSRPDRRENPHHPT